MAKLIMLLTKGGKIFEYVRNTPEEALDTYIKEELGFEKKFSMNQANWQMLSSQTLELDLRILLINSLCKVSNNQIFKVLNSYSVAYPKDPIVYEAIDLTTAKVTDCINPMELSVFSIKDKFESKDVTTIAAQAFALDPDLTNIYIPNTVTTIGYNAFGACFKLKHIIIPDSVTSISYAAFKGCVNLMDIIIPDSVTSIGYDAFLNTGYYNNEDNWENEALYISNHLIKTKDTISGNYTIKDGTLTVADYALYNCTSLESITIPDSITSIGSSAFENCTSLTSITISDSVTSIGQQAFAGCSNLESVVIGSGVQTIGDYVFEDCPKLTKIYYNGTSQEWANISKGTQNSILLDSSKISFIK